MQALYLNVEYRVGVEGKAVVFREKPCKIVFVQALYLVDAALNVNVFGVVEQSRELFGPREVLVAL